MQHVILFSGIQSTTLGFLHLKGNRVECAELKMYRCTT